MILGSNGEKMSKSRGNVINPDDIVKNYGADSLRLYEMFMGPIDAAKPWDPNGIDGAKKFLDRVWRLFTENIVPITDVANESLDKVYHFTVKKVTSDYENMFFNTAISQMMILINTVYKANSFPKQYAEGFLKLLNPVAPHITEELWNNLGHSTSIAYEAWPTYDEAKIVENEIEIPIQINGKLKATIIIPMNESQEKIKEIVHQHMLIRELLKDKNDNTLANSDIPYAGIENYIIPTILIICGIAIIFYVRYNKIKND